MGLHTLIGMSLCWTARPAASRRLIGHYNHLIIKQLWLTVNLPAVTPGTPITQTRNKGRKCCLTKPSIIGSASARPLLVPHQLLQGRQAHVLIRFVCPKGVPQCMDAGLLPNPCPPAAKPSRTHHTPDVNRPTKAKPLTEQITLTMLSGARCVVRRSIGLGNCRG
jgi:hypothetical protein